MKRGNGAGLAHLSKLERTGALAGVCTTVISVGVWQSSLLAYPAGLVFDVFPPL
jgi:hypothetical protein